MKYFSSPRPIQKTAGASKRLAAHSRQFRQYVLALCAAFAILAVSGIFPRTNAQVPATMTDQMPTDDYLKQPGWWPRKTTASRSDFVGPEVCAECHGTLAAGQKAHSMSHTLGKESDLLKRSEGKFQEAPYSYHLYQQGGRQHYSVTDGAQTFSAPIEWTFGTGSHGQSYLFHQNGQLYEARVSFLRDLGFNITPGQPDEPPKNFDMAVGRPVFPDEEIKCFSCHSIASRVGEKFDLTLLMPGISCEGCHGPGAAHVALAKSGAASDVPGLIFNPARLSPPQSVDFCGSCHRTWWDVAQMSGIIRVRFPAARLEESRCWGNGDARLTCANCHNPHQPLVHDAAAYDSKCLACHQQKSAGKPAHEQTAPACRVSTEKCSSCHMQKYLIPGMRLVFTDHKIGIVKGKNFVE